MTDIDQAERRTGIGGGDAAAIAGVSPWRTPLDVYREKIGEAAPLPQTERMRWGLLHEPAMMHEYCRITGKAIRQPPMLRHPHWTWMIGHIDAQILDERGLLETKTAATGQGWGQEGTDQIPVHYLTQCYHYVTLASAQYCDVAVLIGGSDFRLYQVRYDEDICNALVAKEEAFWQCVVNRQEPEPINVPDAVKRWGRYAGINTIAAGDAESAAVAELRQIRKDEADLKERKEKAKLAVMRYLSDRADVLTDLAGTPLVSWKMNNGRKAYSVPEQDPWRDFRLL